MSDHLSVSECEDAERRIAALERLRQGLEAERDEQTERVFALISEKDAAEAALASERTAREAAEFMLENARTNHTIARKRYEAAEAEVSRLREALREIQAKTPGYVGCDAGCQEIADAALASPIDRKDE